METLSVELLSNMTNRVILKHPERAFPGMLIQGDTLFSWYVAMQEIYEQSKASGNDELKDEAEWLANVLSECLLMYEDALRKHGYSFPYNRQSLNDL
jgi:uncharacterized protein DUF6959